MSKTNDPLFPKLISNEESLHSYLLALFFFSTSPHCTLPLIFRTIRSFWFVPPPSSLRTSLPGVRSFHNCPQIVSFFALGGNSTEYCTHMYTRDPPFVKREVSFLNPQWRRDLWGNVPFFYYFIIVEAPHTKAYLTSEVFSDGSLSGLCIHDEGTFKLKRIEKYIERDFSAILHQQQPTFSDKYTHVPIKLVNS